MIDLTMQKMIENEIENEGAYASASEKVTVSAKKISSYGESVNDAPPTKNAMNVDFSSSPSYGENCGDPTLTPTLPQAMMTLKASCVDGACEEATQD